MDEDKGFWTIFWLWAVVYVMLLTTVIYVAVHFIKKWW